MSEKHPIDDLFRAALAQAEVPPPQGVWTGIAAARSGGRRAKLLRWGGAALLLLLLGTVYHVLAPSGPKTGRTDSAVQAAPGTMAWSGSPEAGRTPTAGGTTSADDKPTDEALVSQRLSSGQEEQHNDRPAPDAAEARRSGHTHDVHVATIAARKDASVVAGRKAVPEEAVHQHAAGVAVSDEGSPGAHASDGQATALAVAHVPDGGTTANVALPGRLSILPATTKPPALQPLGATPGQHILARGEWQFSLLAGAYQERLAWRGRNSQLAEALEAAEAHTGTFAAGGMVARTWPSGLGLSTGFMWQRSQRRFFHLDRRVEAHHEVSQWLVTLDTEVIQHTVDTTTWYTVHESPTRSQERRTVLRIPVEAHYHRQWRRWSYGLRMGLALEQMRSTGGMSLVSRQDNWQISAEELAPEGLRRRHPAMLLGMVGADLGYLLHERWSLWASPVYMQGLAPLGPYDEVHAVPGRMGLHVRLTHHLPHRPLR
jgi:hypothetical protein